MTLLGRLQANAFIEDHLLPLIGRINGADEPAAAELLRLLLRERLDWLELGAAVGYFELDDGSAAGASAAVQVYATWAEYPRRAIEESMAWSAATMAIEPLSDATRNWIVDYRRALGREEAPDASGHGTGPAPGLVWAFERMLTASTEDATDDLLRQIYLVHFAPEYQWDPYDEILRQCLDANDFAAIDSDRTTTEDFAWVFAESSGPGFVVHQGTMASPAGWRSGLPLRSLSGLEALAPGRRTLHLEFLAGYVEAFAADRVLELADDEAFMVADLVIRLRAAAGEAGQGTALSMPVPLDVI